MKKSEFKYTIYTIIIICIAVGQAFLIYNIFELDSTEQYTNIPSLLGINIIFYAIVLLIYLRVFIGLGAYELVGDSHH